MSPDAPSAALVTPTRRRWLWPVIAVAAVLLAVAGWFTWTNLAHSTITITGSVQVAMPEDEPVFPSPCTGMGGYSDLGGGAQVVVTDEGGATIAVGQLDPGTLVATPPSGHACVLHFAVAAPAGHQFYGVEVSHRGRLQYPRAALDRPLALTLGD